jgi:competence protein ComEA
MWGFTRDEQRAILFLLAGFVVGSLIWMYRQSQPPPAVNPAEVAAFEDYARILGSDTINSRPETVEGSSKEMLPTARLDLNAATYEELLRLPGIGPVMAKRIIEYRRTNGPFRHPEELKKVKGIGVKTYDKLARLLVIK